MRVRTLLPMMAAGFAVLLFQARSTSLQGQTATSVALTGQVSSREEPSMEGVLVSAKKANSSVTITVVSDETGSYRFPSSRLEPGEYTLSIRAADYELDDPVTLNISAGKTTTTDLTLHKANYLSSQLSNAEWLASMPGSDEQKTALLACVQCHTLQPIVRSRHDSDEFLQVQERMGGYANQATPLHPQRRLADRLLEMRGEQRAHARQALAEYLSTANLSSGSSWSYALKTFPRPKGGATRVIITEYDLPRRTVEPHDVIVDSGGMVWFSDFGEQVLGELDPKTGRLTEFPVPELKHGWPTGALGLQADEDGNLWLGMMFQGGVARFDKKSQKFQTWSIPPDFNKDMTQVNMASPQRSGQDGKVWMQNNGFAVVERLDLSSGKIETFEPFRDSKEGENHNIYDVIPDSRNNAYFTDFAREHIGRVDAKTGKITIYPTPTPHSQPRRGQMDSQDRLWFGEYAANRIGMFDTKTEQFREWLAPTPWSAPYDVVLDKNGDAWTGSMLTDRVLRLNPKTGEFTEYLLPRSTNIRRVFVDNSTTPVTFWAGSNHGASIVKIEPLD